MEKKGGGGEGGGEIAEAGNKGGMRKIRRRDMVAGD